MESDRNVVPSGRSRGQSVSALIQLKRKDCVMTGEERGDVIAFYYNNKVLVKRVIGLPGDWVDIREDGTVYINNCMLIEPYLAERSLGNADIELPYQVPDGKYFVMGDHRATSADSRHTAVGCIGSEQIVGRILFRVWPLDGFGPVG